MDLLGFSSPLLGHAGLLRPAQNEAGIGLKDWLFATLPYISEYDQTHILLGNIGIGEEAVVSI